MYTLTHTHTHASMHSLLVSHTHLHDETHTHTRTHALHLGWHCFRLSIFWCSDTPLEACPCVLETSAVDRLYYVSLSPAQVPVQVFWHFSLLCKQRLCRKQRSCGHEKIHRSCHPSDTKQTKDLGYFVPKVAAFARSKVNSC